MVKRGNQVEALGSGYASDLQIRALAKLRDLIMEVGDNLDQVNEIAESLKWGQPSYEAINPKTGSPIRIDKIKNSKTGYAMYFICTTTLVGQFRDRYGDQMVFEGNRAILFDVNDPLPVEPLKHCIAMALTYRLIR